MNVLVLNGSPAGEESITLQTVRYLEQSFPDVGFEVLHVGQRIKSMEKDFAPCRAALEQAELILFCYPVYTFLVPAQLHRFLELIKENGVSLAGKAATQLTTSKHFYDMTAHRFIEDNCADLGLRCIRGLSADMEDLLKEKGREEALAFFRFVRWSMENGVFSPVPAPAPADGGARFASLPETPAEKDAAAPRIAVVADLIPGEDEALRAMIERFSARMPGRVNVVNLHEFAFAGGCLGCFRCAAGGQCIYRDGFAELLREQIQTADATVYAFTIRDHSMGSRFKLFDDRQFCNGHRTVTMGKPVGYLVDGALENEPNLRTLMEARAEVGGNFLAGIACDRRDPDGEIDRLALTLSYALETHYLPPKNFYGVGGLKIFRDLIWQMQGLMREDHRFYKKHGFYDFPQKRRGTMLGMYLVGGMMNSKRLSKKLGGRMTEGMLMPYRRVLEKNVAKK